MTRQGAFAMAYQKTLVALYVTIREVILERNAGK
jgi:hypothetical protein